MKADKTKRVKRTIKTKDVRSNGKGVDYDDVEDVIGGRQKIKKNKKYWY